MLQAKTEKGKICIPANLSMQERDGLRKMKFFCPSCEEAVIFKNGDKVIPHFSHYSKSNCLLHDRGEGIYHEQGKLLLYQWFKKQNMHVELEKYLPDISQRPDLFITVNKRKIALEYQCARIPIEEIQKRNNGYQKAGIIPIWIMGANRLKRLSNHHFKLDTFTSQFIHQFHSNYPLSLYYFCPQSQTFITIQDVYMTSMTKAIGKWKFMKMMHTSFTQWIRSEPIEKHELFERWKKEKLHFRLAPRSKAYGNERKWLHWIYSKGTNIAYLPSIIHLPIANQYQMRLPTWNWQSRIYLEILHPLAIGATFSLQNVQKLLNCHLHSHRTFPLIHNENHPYEQYFHILEQLQVIDRVNQDTYVKKQHMPFYHHIEEAIQGDEYLLNRILESCKIQA